MKPGRSLGDLHLMRRKVELTLIIYCKGTDSLYKFVEIGGVHIFAQGGGPDSILGSPRKITKPFFDWPLHT